MVISGLIERPQAIQSTEPIVWSSGGHYRLWNGHSIGAIKSASRFDCSAKIAAKTRMAFNITAVSCWTLSLGHILIDYVFGAAIAIAHGDVDGDDKDDSEGVHHIS